MTADQMRITIALMGWVQCGRAYYKMLPDGFLHATVSYEFVNRVYMDVGTQIFAAPLSMTDARVMQLYAAIMRYEKEGLVQL